MNVSAMNAAGWGEIGFTLALAVPLGIYLARVWKGESTWLDPILQPVETGELGGQHGAGDADTDAADRQGSRGGHG